MKSLFAISLIILSLKPIRSYGAQNFVATQPIQIELHVHSPSLGYKVKKQNSDISKLVNSIHTTIKNKINFKIVSHDKKIAMNEMDLFFSKKNISVSSNGTLNIKADDNSLIPIGILDKNKVICLDIDNCTIGMKINSELGLRAFRKVSLPYYELVISKKSSLPIFKKRQVVTTSLEINYKGSMIKSFAVVGDKQDFIDGHYTTKNIEMMTANF